MARIAALAVLMAAAAGCGARDFDYYVFTLSWSPNYCANHDDPGQCQGNRRYSFVVHGLWPQYEIGWPRNCGAPTDAPEPLVESMLDIMPSPALVRHEWRKHGQCTGLDARGYFELVRRAYDHIQIPEDYRQPLKQVTQRPEQIRRKFAAANRGLDDRSVRLNCSGRFLSEVRICVDKNLDPRPCSADVRDTCRAPETILRPVR